MSNFLAVDTSSRHLTVVAVKGGKAFKRYLPDCALNHSVMLMDELDGALKEADLSPNECDFFAAVTGPGSFTGIRIGISAVKGLAVATGKKLLAVTSFDLISYNVNSESDYLVAIDAAHGHYYVSGYSSVKAVDIPPQYMSEAELIALNRPIYGFEELNLPSYTRLDAGDCLYPSVLALKSSLTDNIYALYVRKSQAEEGRK